MIDQIELINRLSSLLQWFVDESPVPEANCTCHINPPCADCVQFSAMRETIEDATAAIQEAKQVTNVRS